LNVHLAKWKRWSREFLPPDPLGGLQSGYARQYNPDEGFTVYLGGHLVGEMKYTIPEAKRILNDLRGWLGENGFYQMIETPPPATGGIEERIQSHQIFIQPHDSAPPTSGVFVYTIRGILTDAPIRIGGGPARQIQYVEKALPHPDLLRSPEDAIRVKILNISRLSDVFHRCLARTPSPNYPSSPSRDRISSSGRGR